MTLETPKCPLCGQPATHVMESQVMYSEISVFGDGEARYTGRRQNDGDPEPVLERDGRSVVYCDDGHIWHTVID